MNFLFFSLATIGLMSIITASSIMDELRQWCHDHLPEKAAQGIDCSQCVGFWSGVAMAAILYPEVTFYSLVFPAWLIVAAICYRFIPDMLYLYCLFCWIFLCTVTWSYPSDVIHVFLCGLVSSTLCSFYTSVILYLDANSVIR